ncbi:MAG: hypothetical protein ACE5GH_06365 [Fidelibacterota bacterium]
MPILTRWFIKLGLVYLVVSMATGVLLASQSFLNLTTSVLALVHVFLHLFMVGWVTQLIFGVAYWMFPGLTRENPRGSQFLGWISLVALNGGLVLRAVAEPLHDLGFPGPWDGLMVLSAFSQWLAALAFVLNTWPRVKGK